MTLDLSQFTKEAEAQAVGRTVPVYDAAGAPYLRTDGTAQTITVQGMYSPAVRRAQDANTQRATKGFRPRLDAETLNENGIRVAVAGLLGWTLELGGTAVPFTKGNATAILTAAPWLHEQTLGAMRLDAEDFTAGSTTSSPPSSTKPD